MLSLLILSFSFSLFSKPYETLFRPINEKPRSSIKGVDGTYIINLDVRPEKWHRVEPLLEYHGIEAVKFSAIFGNELSLPLIREFGAKHLRYGALGCMLSHLSIYHDALSRGLETIWVMEDDVEIKQNPQNISRLIKSLENIDPDWDILYTDLDLLRNDGKIVRCLALPKGKECEHSLSYYTERKQVTNELERIRSRYGTGSMIVSKRGMQKVLNYYMNNEIVWPIDIEIHFIPGIRQYGIIDPVVTTGSFSFNYSDAGLGCMSNFYEINTENIDNIHINKENSDDIQAYWLDFMCEEKNN